VTYAINRYPVELIDVVELANGQRVTLRPVLPQDAGVTQTFVRKLSVESRSHRFLHGLSELSMSVLDQLTRIDYRNHLALLAEIFPGGVETVIAEARYVVEGESAEIAVAVSDEWQGLGLATELLRRLREHAETAGVNQLTAVSLANNDRVIHLARKAGFSTESVRESAELVRFKLEGAWTSPLVSTATSQVQASVSASVADGYEPLRGKDRLRSSR
jgi:GNAT superfamily N-acetyltransferase